MVRSNPKIRKRSKSDGMAKDDSHQGEITRRSSEGESFIGQTTSRSISRIAEDLARITKRLENDFDQMIHTLNRMTEEIADTQKHIDVTREIYKEL